VRWEGLASGPKAFLQNALFEDDSAAVGLWRCPKTQTVHGSAWSRVARYVSVSVTTGREPQGGGADPRDRDIHYGRGPPPVTNWPRSEDQNLRSVAHGR